MWGKKICLRGNEVCIFIFYWEEEGVYICVGCGTCAYVKKYICVVYVCPYRYFVICAYCVPFEIAHVQTYKDPDGVLDDVH